MTEEERYAKYKEIMLEGNQDINIDELDLDDNKFKAFISKSMLMGLKVREFESKCGHKYYIVDIDNNEHILYIPNNVTIIEDRISCGIYSYPIQALRGTVKVMGGSHLVNLNNLFSDCKIETLDLRKLDSSNVRSMHSIFKSSKIDNIIFGGKFKTNKVQGFIRAFEDSTFGVLDLSSWEFDEAVEFSWMFSKCKVDELKITNWSEHSRRETLFTFSGIEIKTLDLRFINLRDCKFTRDMFKDAKLEKLIINKKDYNSPKIKEELKKIKETVQIETV